MKQAYEDLEDQAMAAMREVYELSSIDPAFAVVFMMQGSIALACDNGMSRKDIEMAFGRAVSAYERTLRKLALDTRGLTRQ